MNLCESIFFGVLAMGLMALLVTAGNAQWFSSGAETDAHNLKSLLEVSQQWFLDDANKKKLKAIGDKSGRAFWSEAFKQKLFDADMLSRIVSRGSCAGDRASDGGFIDDREKSLSQSECSYAAPAATSILPVLSSSRGANRSVVFCFDSRNWNNYPKRGVLLIFADSEANFITQESATEGWNISKEDWSAPAEKVIGKVKPFMAVRQDSECASFVNPNKPTVVGPEYTDVYRKKGRTWTHKNVLGKTTLYLICVVKEVEGSKAVISLTRLDEKKQPRKGDKVPDEREIDLDDASFGYPIRATRDEKANTEIQLAGRKWKVEKWVERSGKNEIIYWISTEYRGLLVKLEDPSQSRVMTLDEFKDP